MALKWIIPDHIQLRIARGSTDRQDQMAFTWINGQGIIVLENLFGIMNKWNAKDRQTLRKMNAIWQKFNLLYTSDSWKPYLPTNNPKVNTSSWENQGLRVWNVVANNRLGSGTVEFDADKNLSTYFDLWTGKKLNVINGKIILKIDRFGCVLGLRNPPSKNILALLEKQKSEQAKPLPIKDAYANVLSIKRAKLPPKIIARNQKNIYSSDLIKLNGGNYNFVVKHAQREGDCYPDEDAVKETDYKFIRENGFTFMVHHQSVVLPDYLIMPKVVTNGEFEFFLKKSNYKPNNSVNFLKHWKGSTCPDSIKNKPVVYVSLQDARAYAAERACVCQLNGNGRPQQKQRAISLFLIKFGNGTKVNVSTDITVLLPCVAAVKAGS